MGWTTGQTAFQTVSALVSAGARTEQALETLSSLAHKPGVSVTRWGVLIQCTTGWNGSQSPLFEYDATPAAGSAGQTVGQAVASLVSAGALQDQAVQAIHGLAWFPGVSTTLWGVLVKCTAGWNSGSPAFSVNSTPS